MVTNVATQHAIGAHVYQLRFSLFLNEFYVQIYGEQPVPRSSDVVLAPALSNYHAILRQAHKEVACRERTST